MSLVMMYELRRRFEFFDFDSSDNIKYDKEVFYNIKGYVARAYDNNQKSEIKAFYQCLEEYCFEKTLL